MKKEIKHTPGPWVVKPMAELDSNSLRITTACKWEWDICHVCDGIDGNIRETMEANARLMAESPELYRKLKKAIQYIGLAACNSDKKFQEKMEFLADVMVSIKRIEGENN